jgi:tetratricopeptide (TPR) repeat protein
MTSESPLGIDETVEGVAVRIEEWISLGTPGIVWIRYASDDSRDLLLSRLSVRRPIKRIDFRPPDPAQASDWLQQQLDSVEKADSLPAIAVLFPSSLTDSKDGIASAFRSLNLRRELIARCPVIQLRCVPLSIAPQVESEALDLASWFQLKMTLREIPQGPLTPADDAILDRWRMRTEPLQPLREAVLRYRRLVELEGDSYLPALASAFVDLSARLSHEGKRDEALTNAQEAVDLRRAVAKANPDAFHPDSDLALSVNNLANRLRDVGRREDALTAAQEGVDLYRALAKTNPDAFLPKLAMSVNNLAIMLSDIGRREDALAAAEEAMDLYRALAKANPDAFLPDLAMSLNNLANRLRDVGRREVALAAVEKAVDLYRALAKANPDAFLPYLTASVNNLAGMLPDMGRHEDAFTAAQEAVDLCRPLAKANPDAFLANLAQCLTMLSAIRIEAGDPGGAIEPSAEALQILSPPLVKFPGAFAGLTQACLRDYHDALQATGQEPDAGMLPVLETIDTVLEKLKKAG